MITACLWLCMSLSKAVSYTHLVPLLSRLGSELSGYKDKGLVGMGTLSEGLETNPLHYALFSDRVWAREDISVREWLGKYARQRYGFVPKAVVKALEVLSSSCLLYTSRCV